MAAHRLLRPRMLASLDQIRLSRHHLVLALLAPARRSGTRAQRSPVEWRRGAEALWSFLSDETLKLEIESITDPFAILERTVSVRPSASPS